jgi:hypothetical protein
MTTAVGKKNREAVTAIKPILGNTAANNTKLAT